jgi:hypothetical protein
LCGELFESFRPLFRRFLFGFLMPLMRGRYRRAAPILRNIFDARGFENASPFFCRQPTLPGSAHVDYAGIVEVFERGKASSSGREFHPATTVEDYDGSRGA